MLHMLLNKFDADHEIKNIYGVAFLLDSRVLLAMITLNMCDVWIIEFWNAFFDENKI